MTETTTTMTTKNWWTDGIGPATGEFDQIPASQRTLPALWRRAVRADADREFIRFDEGPRLTLGQVDAEVSRWSAAFADLGLSPGQRVGIMLGNCVENLSALLALAVNGLVLVPINPAFRGEMLRHVLTDSQVGALVTTAESLGQIESRWPLEHLREVVIVGPAPAGDVRADLRLHAAADFPERPDHRGAHDPAPHDDAAVLYTSGTTGPSKGALVSHTYFVFYSWAFAHGMGHGPADVLFTPLPMFHANALAVTLFPAVMVGARAVVVSRFSAGRFWHQIADSRATHFAGMGSMGSVLMRRSPAEFRPDHCLRVCHLVPAPHELPEFERRFGVPVMYATYGMTEGMVVIPSIDGTHRPGLIGARHPYHDVAVVDEFDRPVPDGTSGELVVRPRLPDIMFRGYLDRPDATVEAWRNLWFHTGDSVRRDEHGDLWFLGRLKDTIRRRGENISAFEVEREALACPGVGEAAVLGVPAEVGEDEVLLAVTPVDGVRLDPVQVHAHCARRLPKYMVPRYVDVRHELPKNASQKVLKNELRDGWRHSGLWDAESAR